MRQVHTEELLSVRVRAAPILVPTVALGVHRHFGLANARDPLFACNPDNKAYQ